MMCASYKGNEDCLKALIEGGANPNIQNDNGVTALMIAIPESFDSMENLLRAGADVKPCFKGGNYGSCAYCY